LAGRLGILACGGALPVRIAEAQPEAMRLALEGVPTQVEDVEVHRIEKIGGLFEAMRAGGVSQVVFAGGLARPPLDPAQFDAVMMQAAPRLMGALQGGDDALLRAVIELFEDQGFAVVGAHEVLPNLVAEAGHLAGPEPSAQDLRDTERAFDILSALSPVDVGQGCAVAGGLCLGIETLQGTDAILRFVGETPEALRRGQKGVYVKAAKRGQDLRVDMPAIGPDTIQAVAAAGLAGLVIEAGRVMVLERAETLARAEALGLFLSVRDA
jgi:DUF1009 family protein